MAFAEVRRISLPFAAGQFSELRSLAHAGAFGITYAQSKSLHERGNFQLAKVGVVGSNPIARSRSSDMAQLAEDGGFLGYNSLGNRVNACLRGANRPPRYPWLHREAKGRANLALLSAS